MVPKQIAVWCQDGIDPGWFIAEGIAHPPSDRLIRHLDAAFGEQVLDVAVAQGDRRYIQTARWITSGGKR